MGMCVCHKGGNGATGTDCPVNGATKCATCPEGEYIDADTSDCTVNKCNCDNGSGANGKDCRNNGADQCTTCNVGYYKADQLCKKNMCVCHKGGNGATGTDCPVNGATKCATCPEGEYIDAGTSDCTVNKCNCDNGSGANGKDCRNNGADQCTTCNVGYYKADQ